MDDGRWTMGRALIVYGASSIVFLSLLLFNLSAHGQGPGKTWPVQTKGQEGLRAPQERATLPVPTSGFAKPSAKLAGAPGPSLARRGAGEWALARGWRMAEAPQVLDEGAAVSRPGYAVDGWLRATVPGTVLSTLVDRGVYPDPDYGLYYSPNSRDVNLQGSGPWHYGDPFKFFTTRGRGFSTELGLPSPPSADTIRAMLAPSDHWPPADAWAYHDWHTGGGGDNRHFMTALAEELGEPVSLEDFERKAQLLSYASHRAMFEGSGTRTRGG
jgi:hypothetical protein